MRGDAASRVVMVIFGTNCGFGLVEIIFIAMPAQLTASWWGLLLRNIQAHGCFSQGVARGSQIHHL